jgi:hypothetical protein
VSLQLFVSNRHTHAMVDCSIGMRLAAPMKVLG